MTDKVLAPLPKLHFTDALGNDAAGWKLFIYEAGTTTKAVTWTDATGLTPNTNPIILDARGECDVWFDPATPVDIDPLPAFAPGPQGPDGRPGPPGPVGPPGASNEPSVIRDLSISDIMNLNDGPFILLSTPPPGYYYVVTLIVMQSTIIGFGFQDANSGGLFFFYRSTAGLQVPVSQIAPGDPNVMTQAVNSVDAILSEVTAGSSFSGIAPLSDVAGNPIILACPVQWVADSDPGPVFKAVLNSAGSAYAINDTVTVDGGGGDCIITITGVDGGGAVTAYTITDGGTGYSNNTGNATTATLGVGTGFVVDIYVIAGNTSALRVVTYYRLVPVFVATGAITAATAASGSNAGAGYAVGDEGTVDGGDGNATYRVTAETGGAVDAFLITYGGSAYTVSDNNTTTATSGGGTGFEIKITAVQP